MAHKFQDIGIAKQIGSYSDAAEVSGNMKWLFTSGTPGLTAAGELPGDVTAQSEIAWQHVVTMLEQSGMTLADIVKVTQYLVSADDIEAYGKVRRRFLGDNKPASMLAVIPQLVWPKLLVELEITAATRID